MTTLLKLLQRSDNAFVAKLRRLLPIVPSASAASQSEVNAETASDEYVSPATLGSWYTQKGVAIPSRTKFYFFDDFQTATTTSYPWQVAPSGTGAAWLNANPEPGRPGIGQHSVGSTATGRSVRWFGSSAISFVLGGCSWKLETDVQVVTLSNATDRYAYIEGFANVTTGVNQNNAAYFLYDEGGVSTGSTASPNWQLVTCAGGVRTYTQTSIPVVAGAWTKLRIEINAAGTAAEFYINDTLAAPAVTATLPGAGQYFSAMSLMLKSIGTAARLIYIDFFKLESGPLTR